jgi:hypothetical protein
MKKFIKNLMGLTASLVMAGALSPVLADTAAPAATAAPTAVPTPAVTFDGFVDAYYTYNFTNGTYGLGNGPVFFNNTDNTFSVGEAELDVKATQGAGTGYLALVGGNPNLGLNPGVDILQAYVAYAAGEMTFTGGRFVTWMGNEVIESKSNWNYSRSLLFQYTIPLWHNGVSVAWAPSNSVFGLTGYATSGNNGVVNTGGTSTSGFMATLTPNSMWKFTLNGIFGASAAATNLNSTGELIIAYNPTSDWSFAVDGEYGMTSVAAGTSPSFWGVDLYGKYQIASDWDAALRLEDVSSNGGVAYGAGVLGTTTTAAQIQEVTLTLEKDFTPNMSVRWEGRYDTNTYNGAAQPVYNGGLSTSQVTGTMAAMYTF